MLVVGLLFMETVWKPGVTCSLQGGISVPDIAGLKWLFLMWEIRW